MALGISLMVNNTIAFLSGLFGNRGVFDRTPKTGAHGSAGQTDLRIPKLSELHWSVVPEIALVVYAVSGSAIMFAQGFFMEAQQTLIFGVVMLGAVCL